MILVGTQCGGENQLVKTHVAAPASTRELSRTNNSERNQFEKSCRLFVRARDPSGLTGLGAVHAECGGQTNVAEKNVDLHKHQHERTQKQRKSFKARFTLVCDPM